MEETYTKLFMDCFIDSRNERHQFFSELLPKEIYEDYQRLTQRDYDAFFIKLHFCKYAKIVFRAKKCLMFSFLEDLYYENSGYRYCFSS